MAHPMTPDKLVRIAADFDRIAMVPEPPWTHNTHYHRTILAMLQTAGSRNVLEVGCGAGRLTGKIAEFSPIVTGIDLSPRMITQARSRFGQRDHVHFVQADYLTTTPEHAWDAIVSVATVHHMDLHTFLCKASRDLAPGGQLIILDLYDQTRWEWILNAMLWPLSAARRLWHNGRLRPSPDYLAAWRTHHEHDTFQRLREIRQIADEVIPGAVIRRMLFWRYLLHWVKPA
ncbi:MAG: methyltransferase domain-containing protein [Saprospiraceae bacterium]|nr:methyltransferase domain-containing protein [Saprospiraceae bacterium]